MDAVPQESYVIRTAGKEDLDLIEVLFNAATARHFGDKMDIPLTNLFNDYRAHRMVVHVKDDPMRLLAYSEFGIHPNIPVLSNELWIQWLRCRFCVDVPVTLMNTMFLNFYIYNKHERILKEVLMEVFYREHKIVFLIITRPPKYPPKDYELLEKLGQVYYPIDYDIDKCKDLPTIIIIRRDHLMPVISFRRALAEDNDDIVEIIDVDSPEMRRDHGDYFIAELLLGTSGNVIENDKVVVTEDVTTGVSNGMMWLSEDVDIENFIKNFDLESLGNLVTYTPNTLHTSVAFEVYSTQQQHYTLDRRLIRFTGKCTFLSEYNRLYATFKYITGELQRGSTYLRKETKTLKISFDMPGRRSHLHRKVNPATLLKRACKAFILKNFLLHPGLRMEYAFYYLCAMFSAYPEYDYCVVTVPMGSKISASLSALLQYFMRVPHRPKSSITDEMFLAHRISINTDIEIYPFQKDDLDEIREFLEPPPRASDLVQMHENPEIKSLDHDDSSSEDSAKSMTNHIIRFIEEVAYDVLYNEKSEFNFFIIRAGNVGRENSTTVGFLVLRPFAGYDVVYKQYMLPFDKDNFTFERGELIMLRLHPYFTMWSDEILRTVSLRTGYRDIYYFQPFTKGVLPNDLVSKMMPVEPRRMKRNWFMDTNSRTCLNRESAATELLQLNFMRDFFYVFRHNLSRSKYFGNQNALVIVGFSDVCKALLRLMIFGWNTPDFKNVSQANCLPLLDVTVIVKHGEIESEFDRNQICQICTSDPCYLDMDHCCPFVMDATKRLDLRNWVNFVPGEVKLINRAEKTIQLDNSCKIGYEKLILLCDTDYGLPPEVEEKIHRKKYALPYNYVEINSRLDKVLLYFMLNELVNSNLVDKNIVIYGCNLAVYECINFLLNHECTASDIVFVQPHKSIQLEYENNPMEDMNIQYILLEMVCDLGIKVYKSSQLDGFEVFDEDFHIQTVHFVHNSTLKRFSLKCNIFINFLEMNMSSATEKMLRDSKITIKDRKILVNENFCTGDPSIFAAGKNVSINVPVFYQYANTSELEMAEKLLDIMQLSLEPYTTEKRFSRPKLFHARFPLDYMLVKVIVPKRYMLGKLDNKYSHIMSTYKNNQFCRIRMSTSLILEEITCVVRNPHKDLFFLEYFVGKHDLLLNHLVARFKNGFIDDFLTFFEQPWTECIMHDRFPEMQSKNRDTLISLLQQKQSGMKAMNIGDSDFQATCKHFVEANLLKFLRAHRSEFTNEYVLPEDWENFD